MPPQIMIKNKKGLVNIFSNTIWKDIQCIFFMENEYET